MRRRSKEEKKEVLELKDIVIQKIEKYSLNANRIYVNIKNVSYPTIANIINGKTKYPSISNLRKIERCISENFENSSSKKNSLTKEDKIDKILEILDSHSIKLDIIFELLSSDKGLNNAMQLMKKESQSV